MSACPTHLACNCDQAPRNCISYRWLQAHGSLGNRTEPGGGYTDRGVPSPGAGQSVQGDGCRARGVGVVMGRWSSVEGHEINCNTAAIALPPAAENQTPDRTKVETFGLQFWVMLTGSTAVAVKLTESHWRGAAGLGPCIWDFSRHCRRFNCCADSPFEGALDWVHCEQVFHVAPECQATDHVK